jgi:hypothetical protein
MTGYRAFSFAFVKSFPILSEGFEIETEMTIHALDKNMKILSLPVTYQDRPDGSASKLNTYRDGAKVLLEVFNLYREYRPLSFFGLFSLLFLLLGIMFFIPVGIEYFHTGLVPKMPSLLAAGIFLVLSLLSFTSGIILDVTVKKHRQMFEILDTMFRTNTVRNESRKRC